MSAQLFPMRPNDCLKLARERNSKLHYDDLVKEVARLRAENDTLKEANYALAASAKYYANKADGWEGA